MNLRTFEEFLQTDLRDDLNDPEFVLGYLQASLEEAQAHNDIGVFFLALRDVAQAHGAVEENAGSVGETSGLLFETLSDRNNPEFATVIRLLSTLGMELQVAAHTSKPVKKRAAKNNRASERERTTA